LDGDIRCFTEGQMQELYWTRTFEQRNQPFFTYLFESSTQITDSVLTPFNNVAIVGWPRVTNITITFCQEVRLYDKNSTTS
ncbi:11797_t:CDS:2, partial [Funneliformis geosporum]